MVLQNIGSSLKLKANCVAKGQAPPPIKVKLEAEKTFTVIQILTWQLNQMHGNTSLKRGEARHKFILADSISKLTLLTWEHT